MPSLSKTEYMHNEFLIPFVGLKIGKHLFDFEVGNSFFESMEYSIIEQGNVKVTLELDKYTSKN